MEIDGQTDSEIKAEILTENPGVKASKTSLRMRYEAQGKVIRSQIGDIAAIKQQLGLSSRGLAQLLMVDPSAVTRWIQNDAQIPPGIYRSLQWYLALQEKVPGLTPQYFIGRDGRVEAQSIEKKLQYEKTLIEQQLMLLNRRVALLQRALIVVVVGALLGLALWNHFLV